MNNKSIVDVLTEARDSLTPGTWIKRNYFTLENNTLCMCAHGAVQRIINHKVKPYLEKLNIEWYREATATTASVVAKTAHALVAAGTGAMAVKAAPNKPLPQIWNERPKWIKEDCDYGSRDAHYLLGMVGLTARFNDHPNTTLEMVKEKFNQAIELAGYLKC